MAFAALTIDINAKLANLESGLKRTEDQLSGFKDRADDLGESLKKAFAAAGLVTAATVLSRSLLGAITSLADLDDAAQKSGASVESLSSLLNTLAPTGVGLTEITDLASKLTKAMVGADEETSKAAEAFRLLGVSTKDGAGNLRNVDDVLVEVSQALAGYADGTNKSALAQALLGKSGTEYLPVLKDLAEFQREAASVTAEQAQKAADLQDAWGKLGVEATKLKQSIASEIIPELLKLITQFNAAGAAGASFYERIRASIGPVKFVAELEGDLAALQKRRDALANDKRPLMQRGKEDGLKELDKEIAAIQARIERVRPALRVAEGPSLGELLASSGVDGAPAGKPNAPRVVGDGTRKAAEDAAEAYRKLDEIIRQADLDDTLKQQAKAQDAVNKATAEYLGLLIQLNGNEREGAEAALSPDVQGWQKVADLLREIRGIDTNTKARDASLNVANELLNAGAITFDEYEQLGSKILDLKDPIAEVAAASKDIFAPIESAFEAALFDAEKLSDVVKALAVDIAKIALRQQVTGPLGSFLGGSFDASKDGGTIFGQLLSGITGSGGGPELLNKSAAPVAMRSAKSSGSVMVNQTISYGGGGGRAEAFAFAQTVKADTIRAIKESDARGA